MINKDWSTLRKLMFAKGAINAGGTLQEYTETGAIASFITNVKKRLKMEFDLEPIQDLHGQSNPYPPGGGVNKWDEVWASSLTIGSYSNNFGSVNFVPVIPGETYYFVTGAYSIGSKGLRLAYYDANKELTSSTVAYSSSVTIPSGCYFIKFGIQQSVYGTTYLNDISINYPSTDHNYHPYSNICPITGHDGFTRTGTGKNLFNGTIINGQVMSDGSFDGSTRRITNAIQSGSYLSALFLKAGKYTLDIDGLNYCSAMTKDKNGNIIDNFAMSWNALPFTFTTTKDAFFIFTGRKDNNPILTPSDYFPQIVVGGSVGTYEAPNIHSYSTTFPALGVNQWDEEWEVGNISTVDGQNSTGTTGIRSKNYIAVSPSTAYRFVNNGTDVYATVCFYDVNKNFISGVSGASGGIHKNSTITTLNNAYFMRFSLTGYGTTYNNDVSVNYPSTDTDYHAYDNTVYGGTVTDNGDGTYDLTDSYYMVKAVSPSTFGAHSATIPAPVTASGYTLATNPFYCNRFKPSNYSGADDNHVHFANASLITFRLSEEVGDTKAEWETWFENNPTYVCYKRETPVQYTGLSLTALQSLIGQNNVWIDNSDEVTVTYLKKVQS